jgi:CheY-like chemotaxis protein
MMQLIQLVQLKGNFMIQPMEMITESKTILLIDDDDIIRRLVQICLESFANWRIKVATSGREGLIAIAKAKPDAILLDMMMPDMDGFDFVDELKADAQIADIPIVAMTACTNLINYQSFIELGCKGIISKPFEPITLIPQIKKILNW